MQPDERRALSYLADHCGYGVIRLTSPDSEPVRVFRPSSETRSVEVPAHLPSSPIVFEPVPGVMIGVARGLADSINVVVALRDATRAALVAELFVKMQQIGSINGRILNVHVDASGSKNKLLLSLGINSTRSYSIRAFLCEKFMDIASNFGDCAPVYLDSEICSAILDCKDIVDMLGIFRGSIQCASSNLRDRNKWFLEAANYSDVIELKRRARDFIDDELDQELRKDFVDFVVMPVEIAKSYLLTRVREQSVTLTHRLAAYAVIHGRLRARSRLFVVNVSGVPEDDIHGISSSRSVKLAVWSGMKINVYSRIHPLDETRELFRMIRQSV